MVQDGSRGALRVPRGGSEGVDGAGFPRTLEALVEDSEDRRRASQRDCNGCCNASARAPPYLVDFFQSEYNKKIVAGSPLPIVMESVLMLSKYGNIATRR
jgi:hypothetical protein